MKKLFLGLLVVSSLLMSVETAKADDELSGSTEICYTSKGANIYVPVTPTPDKRPTTGDEMNTSQWVLCATASGVMLILLMITKRKEKDNKKITYL